MARCQQLDVAIAEGPVIQVEGYLWVRDKGSPALVQAKNAFVATKTDPLVPKELVDALHLESGLLIEGKAHDADRPRVFEIDTIEGMPPGEYREKAIPFQELTSIDPLERFNLETEPDLVEPRVAELIEFADGGLVLIGAYVDHDSPVVGKTLGDLRETVTEWDWLVVAVVRNGGDVHRPRIDGAAGG